MVASTPPAIGIIQADLSRQLEPFAALVAPLVTKCFKPCSFGHSRFVPSATKLARGHAMPVGMTVQQSEAQHASAAQLLQQAVELERLLPRLTRQLGMMSLDHVMQEITLRQLRVCLLLETGPLTLSTIGRDLGIGCSAASQIADRLEKAGMVERVFAPDDRRSRYLQLTECGTERMQSWRAQRIERAHLILSRLSCESRQHALRTLNTLLDAACEIGATSY